MFGKLISKTGDSGCSVRFRSTSFDEEGRAKWEEELREMEERHRRQEEMKYCPTWAECYKNCMYAALFTGPESLALALTEWNLNIIYRSAIPYGNIKVVAGLKLLTQSVTLGGAIATGGIAAYCAAHCLINKKAYYNGQ